MSNAARVGDLQVCPMCDGPKPHVGGVILDGAFTVWIGGMPAAVAGSTCLCLSPKMAKVSQGSRSVQIGGKGAARAGDPTDHGGMIQMGCPTVRIG